jgi:hypothetical protein
MRQDRGNSSAHILTLNNCFVPHQNAGDIRDRIQCPRRQDANLESYFTRARTLRFGRGSARSGDADKCDSDPGDFHQIIDPLRP